jgi:glycosyltransferase involved in cell wall biosynthesis
MAILVTTYHGKAEDAGISKRGQYLCELIESIDKVIDEESLHVIVDDGSTDNVCKELEKIHCNNTQRIFLRREKPANEPLTSTNARNFAISKCLDGALGQGQKYITFVDSDDLLIDINSRIELMESRGLDFLYSDAFIFFNHTDTAYFWKGMEVAKHSARGAFWVQGRMPYPTMVWSIEFIRTVREFVRNTYKFEGPFDPRIGCGEDVDIALSSLECAGGVYKIAYLPHVTVGYRIHDNSLASIRNGQLRAREEHGVLVRHFGYYGAILLHIQRFIHRPECYIASLWPLRNLLREKSQKSNFIGS